MVSHPFLFIAAFAAAAVAPGQAAAAQGTGAAAAPAKPMNRADVVRDTETNFAEVDANKDGSWSKTEIEAAQAKAEQRATSQLSVRMNQEFTKLDTDKNGQLSLAEFRAAAPAVRVKAGAGTAAIQRLDSNKDGKVSLNEYRAPLLAGFDKIDSNKDGTISADERARASAPAEGR